MSLNIKKFKDILLSDIASVGGKNASLGELYNELSEEGVNVPNGFATTAAAYWNFLSENKINKKLEITLKELDRINYSNLSEIGTKARQLILNGQFSNQFINDIIKAYHDITDNKQAIEVAVRSSATAEDLPNASFAGQHDSFLNIKGNDQLLITVKKCFASLYTNRAIKYREDNGFKHEDVALSVGVQIMVRSDKGCSGVGFTLDPESGFDKVVLLSGVWGLGENMVQGTVNPDEFIIHKPTLLKGFSGIIQKKLGLKEKTMIYATSQDQASTINIDTPIQKQSEFILSDEEIRQLAHWSILIEHHYQKPMDIEWAKDGNNNELYIIQARPETIHKSQQKTTYTSYKLKEKGNMLVKGNAIGRKIVHGKVRLLSSPAEGYKLQTGDVIVTDAITPDWDPLLKKVNAIITNKGGRTSHAAIVARELDVPAIVGCINATEVVTDNQEITVSCASGHTGYIYPGIIPFEESHLDFSTIDKHKTEAKLILSDPDKAFELSFYPNDGVGLLRMEFIITHLIKVHPMALIAFEIIKDEAAKQQIKTMTSSYNSKREYFIDKLSKGIATIAAAFYPKEVIVRLSDFKTNEYANLIGGKQFEPSEENPMLGFRGASRYYSDAYKEGFKLECQAIKRVRDDMGFTNLKVMVPFCRTLSEGKRVIEIMKENGLEQGQNQLEIYCMLEIPGNVILAEEYAAIFDGFSIGSNDLTQLTLGVDRDSALISDLFNENDPAAKKMIAMAIAKARKSHTTIGLCGQAPSDYPDFARFLVQSGINSISFNPDALIQGIQNINKAEAITLNKE
ncbi:phosphoenolpyruvate synthase [Zhouia amylolytica]|uniref:Phosphoenolpyruvate synthase n=1 Tax=Zhouia amylolytica AD3 TaxID=1286632 RepID=W2UR99_9FLAO|nr:phosphoenolpyruvate synthase [Zhouia amylolytica]ETN96469.1 phosphoenolpyruvate synthase [Zhouia amylolytica AD3]